MVTADDGLCLSTFRALGGKFRVLWPDASGEDDHGRGPGGGGYGEKKSYAINDRVQVSDGPGATLGQATVIAFHPATGKGQDSLVEVALDESESSQTSLFSIAAVKPVGGTTAAAKSAEPSKAASPGKWAAPTGGVASQRVSTGGTKERTVASKALAKEAHKDLVAHGFVKGEARKEHIPSQKMGRSEAWSGSSDKSETAYSHSDGRTARLVTRSPKYGDHSVAVHHSRQA